MLEIELKGVSIGFPEVWVVKEDSLHNESR